MFQKPGANGVEGISLLAMNKQANSAYDQVRTNEIFVEVNADASSHAAARRRAQKHQTEKYTWKRRNGAN